MTRCGDCGGNTIWDEDVCSNICTSCGTLQDPSQTGLASHLEQHDNSARQYNPLWDSATSSTLKVVRGGNGWDLLGQGKEARDRRNTYAMHEFIRSISSRLSNPGLFPRAVTLFTQAMTKGGFRWGRKAKLAAGASMAFALRESHKPDSIREIASLIGESFLSLNRIFKHVVTLLQLDVPSTDPALHLPAMQTHLQSLIEPTSSSSSSPSPLPPALLKLLIPIPLPTVFTTATSLCTLLTRLTPTHANHAAQSTSCAILILSLEAEARTSLPHIGELAQLLATRFRLGKGIVMSRYKVVYDLLEEWIKEVPWLDKFESKGKEKGRSKLAKRTVVARGIKDVIQFQEEIWRKKLEAQSRLNVELDADPADDIQSDEDTLSTTTGSSLSSRTKRRLQELGPSTTRKRKRRKTKHQGLDDASIFLLDPLNATIPDFGTSRQPSPPPDSNLPLPPRSTTPPPPPAALTSYLLNASPATLSLSHKPTRLQLLATERAGGVEDIKDDELFDDGELEAFIRSESEVKVLRNFLGWGQSDSEDLGRAGVAAPNATKVRTNRVDMGALARVLGNNLSDDEDEDESEAESEARNYDFAHPVGPEEVEDWRPLSPDNGGGTYDSMDRYDQEY